MCFASCSFRGVSIEALQAQLHSLDSHSALYVLHCLTPLAQYEERKILELLQQLPNTPATGHHHLHHHHLVVCGLQCEGIFGFESKIIVALFPPADESQAAGALSPAVHRNVVLFQGFCAMKYALYALCVNAHNYSNCRECESMQQQQHHQQITESDTSQNQTSTSSEGEKN